MVTRVGQGFDSHRLVPGRRLVLGGVEIPHDRGLLGHSDADVLVHAVIDAVIGALALGDIGRLYPDNDPAYKDADSLDLLRRLLSRPEAAAWRLGNLDSTVVAERPKLAPHIPLMRERLALVFGCPVDLVSVKAKTSEGMGFCGAGEGMAAFASVLMEK